MSAKNGDMVKVSYTAYLEDGAEFNSSPPDTPVEVVIGQRKFIPGFEDALIGSKAGSHIKTTVPPKEAYGDRDEDLIFKLSRSEFPDDIKPECGMCLQISGEQGELAVVITEVTDDEVTFDGNHPLAGKNIIYEINVLEVVPCDA